MAARIYQSFAEASKSPEKVRRLYVVRVSPRTVLPDFRAFAALEELTIHDGLGCLTRFPDVFGCTRLRELALTGMAITKIPRGFEQLERLERLVLVGNRRLKTLPEDLVELPKLRQLSVDNNHLTSLPSQIGRLRALEELVAYGNAIRALPPSLYRLPRLRWLELQGNDLASPPLRLMKMKLRHLQTDFPGIAQGL